MRCWGHSWRTRPLKKVFGSDPHSITAGVVHPYGTAVVSDGGYRVTGRWSYASGCQHSTWIFCCCEVFDGDQRRLADDGEPDVRLFFIPIGQVSIIETWDVSGLAGTGSHDVVIDQVFVPAAYTCAFKPGITPQGARYQSPVYRYVLYASFALPIGAVALGIAQGALDACLELAQRKSPTLGRRCCATARCFRSVSQKRWRWCARLAPGYT